jgi:ribosomal protein S18 acetylase RimI-like enzyme
MQSQELPSKQIINPLSSSDIDHASKVMARAFHEDPMMTYIIPEPERRPGLLRWFMLTSFRYGLRYGEVYTTDKLEGATIWLTPGNTTMTFGRMLRAGMMAFPFKMGLGAFNRFMKMVDYAEKGHKKMMPGPHWYLLGIGVEPACQGQGIGGFLMQPVLARADAERLPCYLETMNEANLPFYQKYGFKVALAGHVQEGLPLWAMVREPQPR